MAKCSCWHKYPNELQKKPDGKWKCVDDYQCIRDLVEKPTSMGLVMQLKKTVCERRVPDDIQRQDEKSQT